MAFRKINFSIKSPSVGIGLVLLAITQVPLAVNESLRFACFATTMGDYAVFWSWKDIPLDARINFCQGGSAPPRSLKDAAENTNGLKAF